MVNFEEVAKNLKDIGFLNSPDLVNVRIPGARDVLWNGFKFFVGDDKAKWIEPYDEVARWMENNSGRGLLLLGSCGLGKSVIATKILPCVLNHYCRKVVTTYDAQQMNKQLDEVKSKHIVCLDDVGTEGVAMNFGERRMAFSEVVDEAERKGKLLLITTNLNVDELQQKYGERTIDRLRQITKPILFVGKSFRG